MDICTYVCTKTPQRSSIKGLLASVRWYSGYMEYGFIRDMCVSHPKTTFYLLQDGCICRNVFEAYLRLLALQLYGNSEFATMILGF